MGRPAASPVKRAANGGPAGGTATGLGGSSVATNGGGSDDLQLTERTERVESTIVSRENATHLAFAASRSRDFVYAASSQYIRLLDDYCNSSEGSAGGTASPLLVVVGQPGTGKSSLLAHWAALRRASEDGAHEFIYEHYSGCSYDSVKLSLFLFRLMNQLKVAYSLRDFELPHEHEEEKLKFSFARCLEAAVGRTNQRGAGSGSSSKRRNIVLILDGIDCIRTEDGGDSLSWLPNTFPLGVRIIVSANHSVINAPHDGKNSLQRASRVTRKPVVYDGDGDLIYDTSLPPSEHDSHTIRELRRRRVSFVVVEPLDESSCRAIIQLYNIRSPQASLSRGEEDAIVDAPGSANPLYLRLILQGQELFHDAAERFAWLERVTRATEIHSVYELLIRRWNEILLEDLNEQLRKLSPQTDADDTDVAAPPTPTHKLTRRATKRDVTAAADSNNSHAASQLAHPSPTRTSGHAPPCAADPVELENLYVAMEQRVLLVRHTLSLLSVSRYGLSETDLLRLLEDSVPRAVCQRLLGLLAPHLMQIRRRDCGSDGEEVVLLDLSHNQLRLLVRYGFLGDDHMRHCYYKELATYFGGLEASQRRVDELPVQLERCSMWSALQGALVDMKMFQLWWHERNRQEFFSYWMVLRANCSIHDPVDDFIRSLDEYVAHESPSAEQLLSLCLTITDFLRAWQRVDDSRSGQLALARPPPPQLNEFIASLGGFFSTTHLSEHEARRVQSEIDALCIHKDDAYFVRRWLWTQFPLIATAFESRFLRSLLAGKSSSTASLDPHGKEDDASSSGHADKDGGGSSSAAHAPGSGSAASKTAKPVVLPKSFGGHKSHPSPLHPARRKPSLLFKNSSDSLASSTDDGAFEFLSAENTELTVGSVSKYESQVMELRARHDKLRFAAKEKQSALRTLELRLLDARAQARANGQSASQVDELLEHIRVIGEETTLGRQRGDYYKAILRHCEIHPARDPNAIEVTETAVNRMRQDIVELQQKTQVASYEARLASVESRKLQQVVQDKSQIHNAALERLRWRFELLQRMMVQQRRATAGARADGLLASDSPHEQSDEEAEDATGDGEDNNGESRRQRKPSTVVDERVAQFNRAKDKLLHKKETTLERLRKVESLKVYLGGPYKDDGVLGALRQVGINKPEEAHLYWQDQQLHAAQLEAEERSLEQRVGDFRDKLATLQSQLLNLKLGGGATAEPANAECSPAAAAAAAGVPSSAGGAPSMGDAPSLAVAASTHNLKLLEQRVGDALAVAQQKKERAARAKALAERLHLGLHHVAQILGVQTTQQMESIELADAVEQVVRLYLGDEGHLQSASSSNLRRKNSARAMGMASQSGLHAIAPPDTRSPDEKRRFNVRVSRSPQRQMNPYVDDAVGSKDADDEDDNDCDEEDDDDDDGNQQADTVTRRADIKTRSRLEVDRRLRAQSRSGSTEKKKKKRAEAKRDK